MEEKEIKTEKTEILTEDTKKTRKVWTCGILLAFIGALLMLSRYPQLPGLSEIKEPSVSNFVDMNVFQQLNYVLYRNLYNVSNNETKTYTELYGPVEYPELTPNSEIIAGTNNHNWEEVYYELKQTRTDYLESSFYNAEERLWVLTNDSYDYWIQDKQTGKILTNTVYLKEQPSVEEYSIYLEFFFDENGHMTVGTIRDTEADSIRSHLYNNGLYNIYDLFTCSYTDSSYPNASLEEQLNEKYFSTLKYETPKNCIIIFGMQKQAWENYVTQQAPFARFWGIYHQYSEQYLGLLYASLIVILTICGWYYANPKLPRKREAITLKRLPFEAVLGILFALICFGGSTILEYAAWLYLDYGYKCHGVGIGALSNIGILAYSFNMLCITLVFLTAWYCGCCLGEIRILGIKNYFSRRSLFKRAWKRFQAWLHRYYNSLVMLDVTGNVKKKLRTLLIINAVILFLFTSLWFFGWLGVFLYSLLLYWILKRYISDIQKKYSALLNATNQIADGNLNVTIEENLGVFEAFKPQIYKIQKGFKTAVEEEVKSQKMKNELITNVSHDLKTPLTAIITYINLLKEPNVSEEERKQYLDILELKSLRLKGLIEDLFEVSKANSGNMTVNAMDVDLVNLLKQVHMEWEAKLQEKHLTSRLRLPDEKLMVKLDSQKAYRIYENLFGNIYKYALEGTRVYVDIKTGPDNISVSLKNITAAELNVSADELTERFVRGDTSRGTEGSGLGLAIVKSFTELMGGKFYIQLDGDLFTATTVWPISW